MITGIFRSRPPRGDEDDTVEISSDTIADLDEG